MACRYRKIAKQLHTSNADARIRLRRAQRVLNIEKLLEAKVNRTTLDFFLGQLRNQPLLPRGRRFSVKDKFFALSLMKASSKGYKLLKKIFALPSRGTLLQLLSGLPFACGINAPIMQNLKATVDKMSECNKLCVLLFDKMSLEPGLEYSTKKDEIVGFEDYGDGGSRCKFADHVLVFMARGIVGKWKQPICYYFCESGMKTSQLVVTIKAVIRELSAIGLKVVTTTCDQLSTNVAAYKRLREETAMKCFREGVENRYWGFVVGEQEIVPLFDAPHLLKGLRNNFVLHKARFHSNGEWHVASWGDILTLHDADTFKPNFKLFTHLTDAIVDPKKMKKMKVSFAAKVFSYKLATLMQFLATNRQDLSSIAGTAELLLFGDRLFDSVNGVSAMPPVGKKLRSVTKQDSEHEAFWREAKEVLGTLKFLRVDESYFVPPTVKNWIATISGLQYLWNYLKTKLGLNSLATRKLDQDPLENLFGGMSSHGIRNVKPTCCSFVSSFKTLIINNLVSPHSPNANCGEDYNDSLDNLKQLISCASSPKSCIEESTVEDNFGEIPCPSVGLIHPYIAGYLARALLKKVSCNVCREDLLADTREEPRDLMSFRAGHYKSLIRPNTRFTEVFVTCSSILSVVLPHICAEQHLKLKLNYILLNRVQFNFRCQQHKLHVTFTNILVPFFIQVWIKNVNKILKGLVGARPGQVFDHVQQIAHEKYKKCRARKIRIQHMKQL